MARKKVINVSCIGMIEYMSKGEQVSETKRVIGTKENCMKQIDEWFCAWMKENKQPCRLIWSEVVNTLEF